MTDSAQPVREPEHRGSIWTHPYMLYVWLTMALFGVLLFLAWLAVENGWIPSRGVHSALESPLFTKPLISTNFRGSVIQ